MKMSLLIPVIFGAIMSSCSNSGSGDSKAVAQPQLQNAGESSIQLKESYQLNLNGCDTGKHNFQAASTDEVKKQLCEALQDDKLNNSCAEPLRREFFEKKCAGISWSPKTLEVSAPAENVHVFEVTALNFLKGGFEPCNVSNKIYFFSRSDKNVQIVICENSRFRVSAISNAGILKFRATIVGTTQVLSPSSYSDSGAIELGRTQPMLRYGAENPFGFTYVMAQEVTGIDPDLLAQWNELNSQVAGIRAQIITAQKNGSTPPKEAVEQLRILEMNMQVLAQKIQDSRK